MSNWIQLNIKYNGIRVDEALKIARQNKISKPSVPMLENEALKKLGFNNETLFKEYKSYGCFDKYYYNTYYYSKFFKGFLDFLKNINTKKDLLEYFKKNKKGIYNYNYSSSRDGYIDILGVNFNYDQVEIIGDNINSIIKTINNMFEYVNFIKNHPKTIKYNERIIEFNAQIEKIKKDNCFTISKYNKPGYLVNIETPDGQLSQFLIGHGSHLNIPNDSKVIRVKKVVDDDEIFGNLLFA